MAKPEPGGGITWGPPETHSSTTVSPDCTVTTGGIAASKMPQRTVLGVAGTWWTVMRGSESEGSKDVLF